MVQAGEVPSGESTAMVQAEDGGGSDMSGEKGVRCSMWKVELRRADGSDVGWERF